jgi:hypothetical protein
LFYYQSVSQPPWFQWLKSTPSARRRPAHAPSFACATGIGARGSESGHSGAFAEKN